MKDTDFEDSWDIKQGHHDTKHWSFEPDSRAVSKDLFFIYYKIEESAIFPPFISTFFVLGVCIVGWSTEYLICWECSGIFNFCIYSESL